VSSEIVSLAKVGSFDGGGAHPISFWESWTINVQDDRIYDFNDLFQGHIEQRLEDLIPEETRHLKWDQNQEFLLFEKEIFLFTGHRLVPNVRIPYSQLRGCIDPDGPIPMIVSD
jgi:hypothetical protein